MVPILPGGRPSAARDTCGFYLRHDRCTLRRMIHPTLPACIGASALFVLASFTQLDRSGPVSLLRSEKAVVTFTSDAPLERISATTTSGNAIVDTRDRSFAVQVPLVSFSGFNSPLQREHFNENYLESGIFPSAVFKGRIIENVDLAVPGDHTVRAKGELTIHGVARERIIACDVVVSADGVRVTSTFPVTIAEHDIRVPMVVRQKIAPVVSVQVDLLFRTGKIAR